MAAPWTWRLDPGSGPASILGPSTFSAAANVDPLSALAQSASASSADDIVWHDFRPQPQSSSTRLARKRARLHRFDSDDEDESLDRTLRAEPTACDHTADAANPGDDPAGQDVKEEEDADDMANTSSSDNDSDEDATTPSGPSKQRSAEAENRTEPIAALTASPISSEPSARKVRRPTGVSSADAFAASTRIMAHTIYSYSVADGQDRFDQTAAPPPLTYKETVRLVHLIAMIFRFPKPSRRISRRRVQSTSSSTPALSSSSRATPTPAEPAEEGDDTLKIELKPKYLPRASGDAALARKPRMLAKVHPEDTRMESAAVLKLLALLPAALPGRVSDAAWVASLAVRARRDEYGNILLPNSAYASPGAATVTDDAAPSIQVKEEDTSAEAGAAQKVTRSQVQRLGREAPSIPLPEFWRRPLSSRDAACKVEQHDTGPSSSSTEVAEVEDLTALAAEVSQDGGDSVEADALVVAGEQRQRVVNLSKLLAERMRDKRQAKTLLLRTHHTLRKRRSAEPEQPPPSAPDEDEQPDAETLANTAANALTASDQDAAPQAATDDVK